MGFKDTVLFMLNMVKKSLQIELNDFFESILNKDTTIKKQAYSAARQKIKPELFIDLNDTVNRILYDENKKAYETWNGYRLTAIDGSIMELPQTDGLLKEFGGLGNQNYEVPRARASCLFDVLNRIVIKSRIDRYDSSERESAVQMVRQMLDEKKEKELILFDRGYPSAPLMGFLIENGIDFVMRSQRCFSNDVMNAKKENQFITIKYNKKLYKVRVLRFLLDSGEEEILLTSLYDENLGIEDFKKLYFLRWGIETKYDELKNRLEIDNFTGTTRIAIEQDFYASIYISNMVELARQHNDDIIKEKNEGKELKYEYKTNLNVLVGCLKDRFVMMLLEKSKRKRDRIFKSIISQISGSTVPVRPGRQNERKHKRLRSKYKTNHKRCL